MRNMDNYIEDEEVLNERESTKKKFKLSNIFKRKKKYKRYIPPLERILFTVLPMLITFYVGGYFIEQNVPEEQIEDIKTIVDNISKIEKGDFDNLELVYLNEIVDGNTFVVKKADNTLLTVVLLGVDYPKEKEFDVTDNNLNIMLKSTLDSFIPVGAKLYLEYDSAYPIDDNNTVNAYIWMTCLFNSSNVTKEDVSTLMLNGYLISNGYGKCKEERAIKYGSFLQALSNNAELENLGFWYIEKFKKY